jgi:hypothetical protein
LARFKQTDRVRGAETHAVGLAIAHVPEEPTLDARLGDLKGQSSSITIQSWLEQLGNLQGSKLVELPWHEFEFRYF